MNTVCPSDSVRYGQRRVPLRQDLKTMTNKVLDDPQDGSCGKRLLVHVLKRHCKKH